MLVTRMLPHRNVVSHSRANKLLVLDASAPGEASTSASDHCASKEPEDKTYCIEAEAGALWIDGHPQVHFVQLQQLLSCSTSLFGFWCSCSICCGNGAAAADEWCCSSYMCAAVAAAGSIVQLQQHLSVVVFVVVQL